MSGPYIQFELDAAKKAPLLASVLGIQLREAMGGLALMWLHVYGEGKSDIVTAFFLRAFFGVDGSVAANALVELNFLEPADGGWRVRGSDRYRRLSEVRREAGRKGAAATNGKRSAIADQKPAIAEQEPRQKEAKGATTKGSAGDKNVPSERSEHVGNCRGKDDEAPAIAEHLTKKSRQKSALDPRSDISLSLTGERALSNAGAHAREPAGFADWPSPECEEAALAWVEAWASSPPGALLEARKVAVDYPHAFLAGVAAAIRNGLSANPLKQLRDTCEGFAIAGRGPTKAKAGAPPEWPGAQSEPAMRRYLAAVAEHGPLTGPPATLTPHTFAELAREFGDEHFAAAVDECIAKGPTWPGWRQSRPLGWIRQECERVRHAATERKAKRSDIGPGDRYTPRFRPEPGAPAPVYEPVRPKSYPEPQGRITPSAEWEATWAAARVAVANLLDPDDDEFYLAPLTPLGVSDAGELVLAADSPETRERVVGQVWEGFIAPAVEKALKARKQPPSELRITIRERASARGAA